MARAHGFIDPAVLLTRLSNFTQGSDLSVPVELMRAVSVLYARGMLNAYVIQQNMDWIWPFWVTQQFDPKNISFIPRAFSITNINLTHRNWTAVGLPDIGKTPIVDPRGLIMPFWDSWSLDTWIVSADHEQDLLPSQMHSVNQRLEFEDELKVVTCAELKNHCLTQESDVFCQDGMPVLRLKVSALSASDAFLIVSIRPYNPEGVSFIKEISVSDDGKKWKINKQNDVFFDTPTDFHYLSDYYHGDVYLRLFEEKFKKNYLNCPVEMATGAACFRISAGNAKEVVATIPLSSETPRVPLHCKSQGWKIFMQKGMQVNIPDDWMQKLYESSLSTVLLHTAEDVYPGPYTYRRFWFRDAAFITRALIICGFSDRAERIIDSFSSRQKISGYFESQDGEWDSNGQVLWLIAEFCSLTGRKPKNEWKHMIYSGAHWIIRKRLPASGEELYAGLMPTGFSAEHFGPNDYYYWDDFWGVAGLEAASYLSSFYDDSVSVKAFQKQADDFKNSIEKSLQKVAAKLGTNAMPSSPYRRLDSSSVGSLVAGYPLQLWQAQDPRLGATAKYLTDNYLIQGAFYHNINHSGINPYLTLHIAQILLRKEDERFFDLMESIAALASPTGQWPEAIHPRTKTGCMGDGQHVWAAAEWLLMLRNCFVREEEGKLVLCSGIPKKWLGLKEKMVLGPCVTSYGPITVTIEPDQKNPRVTWQGDWYCKEPPIEVRLY